MILQHLGTNPDTGWYAFPAQPDGQARATARGSGSRRAPVPGQVRPDADPPGRRQGPQALPGHGRRRPPRIDLNAAARTTTTTSTTTHAAALRPPPPHPSRAPPSPAAVPPGERAAASVEERRGGRGAGSCRCRCGAARRPPRRGAAPCSRSSRSAAHAHVGLERDPAAQATGPQPGTSPSRSSGRPTTAASTTSGCSSRVCSTSTA